MKQAIRLVAKIMIVPVLVALCAGLITLEAAAAPEGKPILIGASLPITGGFSINGQKHKSGYELWAKLVNEQGGLLGRPVKIIVNDNQSSVEASLAQIERFINVDKVELLLGTFSSKLTFPMSAIAEQAKMVYPIPSGGALKIYERGFKYIFFFQPTAAEYVGNSVADMILHYVPAGDRPKTVALAWADDFFANAISAGMLGKKVDITGFNRSIDMAPGTLSKAGMEVVFAKQWPEEGFSDWITLANSIKASGAEYLVGLVAFPDEVIMLSRALKTVGYQPKGAYFCQGTQEEVKEGLGDSVNGLTIHSAWHRAVQWEGHLAGKKLSNQEFVELFKKEFGHEPDEDEAIPFATCQGLEQAVRAVGSTDNTAIRNWLASRTKQSPVKTVLGDFYFDERGLAKDKPFLMAQWQDGKLKFIYPVGQFPGTTDLVWPKPKW
jgi:branched-chain amino acid transport system substrate-binding protein